MTVGNAISRTNCLGSLGKGDSPLVWICSVITAEILCAAIGSVYPASHSPTNCAAGTFGSAWPSSSGRVVGPSWFDLPLLGQRQLLAKKEILRSQGTAGM